ncbi:MAG: hypothetical protein PUC36_04660 [Clostridiales bacterium]|nr:hypothetical protein [Clostridiales bacterium]
MTIQPIGNASVALYITPADLAEYGYTPAGLTLAQALVLTRAACADAGIVLEGTVEIEAYPECCGVLIFARVRPGGDQWFTFDDLEALLSAALALRPAAPDAALWWWEGRYWLSLPAGAERAAAVCCEFGALASPDPLRRARLEECGSSIFSHNALSALCYHFLRLHL